MKRFLSLSTLVLMSCILFANTGLAQQDDDGAADQPLHLAALSDSTRDGGMGDGHRGHEEGRKGKPERREFGVLERLARILPEEAREPAKKLLLEHRNKVYPLKQRIEAKEHELNALIATPETTEAQLQEVMTTLTQLKSKKLAADVAMRRDFFQTTGFPLPGKPGGRGR